MRAESQADLDFFQREMAYSPARLSSVLRMSLSVALSALLLLILQEPPFLFAPSIFMLALISRETPRDCFKGLCTCVGFGSAGTLGAIALVAITENAPEARVLGVAVVTFLCGFLYRASTMPVAAISFASVYFMATSLWEKPLPAEPILHLSLWPLGTLSTVACCALVVEFLFNGADPVDRLDRELAERFRALEDMFSSPATHAADEHAHQHWAKVLQYAGEGPARMYLLLDQLPKDGDRVSPVAANLRDTAVAVTRLLDLGAAIAVNDGLVSTDPERVRRIGQALLAAREQRLNEIAAILGEPRSHITGELDQFEQTLHGMGHAPDATRVTPEGRAAKSGAPVLLPDAFTNLDYLVYALKLSICGTAVYVIFNALNWGGISNCYFTVLYAGLSTTGTTNKKLLFRIIGSGLGSLVVGIGCISLVFPHIETVTGFLLVVATVAFLGAWIACSPYFGYIGLQLSYAFNLLAFEGYSAATEITPARDRMLGILLGILVMLLVFHQVRPERTVDTMRRSLARLLRLHADLIRLVSAEESLEVSARVVELKAGIGQIRGAIHTFADGVQYEFEPDRTGDLKISAGILNAVSISADLLVSVQASIAATTQWPEGRLREFCLDMEKALRDLARTVDEMFCPGDEPQPEALRHGMERTEPKSVEKAIDCYRELQRLCQDIVSAPA